LCGLGVLATLDADSRVQRLVAAYISVGPAPVLVDLTETVVGQAHDAVDLADAAALAESRVDPDEDIHATASYRRHLAGVLTRRAAAAAVADAHGRSNGHG